MYSTSYMIKEQALILKERSSTDTGYVNNVKIWVYKKVQTPSLYKGTSEINPPEIAYLTGTGDCSERGLLIARMLNEGGIEAHPIYGTVGSEGHESVEYTINGIVQRVDEHEFPNFIKHGDGISKSEYVYDVYWFIDWSTVFGINKNDNWKYYV